MATPNVGILTNAGKNLIDQVNAGQTKITFSKIVFSSMDNNQLTDDQIKALTTVAPQEIVVNNPEVTLDNNTGETRIRATGNNEALTDGVYVKTYAVYAKDDSGNEILYGTTISPNPNYLPEYDSVTPQAVTYSYKVNISNTSNITFTNSNDIYVSDTDLAEALQPYAKTVDVNQQLDKKVNIADMRKPASDVAGIEEVNAKQDEIAYTPADDSKVVHTTDTSNWQKNKVTNDDGSPFVDLASSSQDLSATLMSLSAGFHTVYANSSVVNSPFNGISSAKGVIDIQSNATGSNAFGEGFLIGTKTNQGILMYHVWLDGSKANYTQIANDSTVAHLSGANNFDTVPTVNNNPLLLASSLPSDLARTGSDQEFTGKNTFDTAPIDKTTGNPYITKDGVPSIPSDVARTGQAQTFTQQQTFSIAPVINDASTDKGDNQAATMADLKSVEESAWRVLDQSNAPSTISFRGQVLYKIDDANKIIYFTTNGLITDYGSNLILINFKGIVNDLLSGHGRLASVSSKTDIDDSDISVTSTYVKNSEVLNNQYQTNVNLISYGDPGQNYAYVIYDSLVN